MRKTYTILFSIVFALLPSYIFSQTVLCEEKFDEFIAGQKLACQNSIDWTTWSILPCDATEDAYISNNYALSDSLSVVIVQNNDLVKRYGGITTGLCEINFHIYIPTGKAGYFNTLATFNPPTYEWAMQCWFDANGTARLDANGASAATFSYNHNAWQMVKLVVDLEFDNAKLWFNGSLILSWQWTKGVFTGSSCPHRLDAMDLFGATANDEMYVDDYAITYYPKITSTAAGGNWTLSGTWAGGIVPLPDNPVVILNTATVSLNNNITRNGGTLVNGILYCGEFILTGPGNFVISPGATLGIGSTGGISLTGASGNIQVIGKRTFNTSANYIFNGSLAQASGNGIPTVNNLTINNTAGVTLNNKTTVNGTLTFIDGNINTGTDSLVLGGSGVLSGEEINQYLVGNLFAQRTVGTGASSFGNIGVSLSSGTDDLGTVNVLRISGIEPAGSGNKLLRSWNITSTNPPTAGRDITFNWVSDDDNGIDLSQAVAFKSTDDGVNWNSATPAGGQDISSTRTITVPGVTSFSLFTVGDVNNPLPVELSSFMAAVNNGYVLLTWQTKTEIDNYGFNIERRQTLAATNEMKWQKIGFVKGSINSSSTKNYTYTDKTLLNGKFQYRLEQINTDGKFKYYDPVETEINNMPTNFELSNYPNPFNPSTTIYYSVPTNGHITIKVFNLLGVEVSTLVNEEKSPGNYKLTFDGVELSSGVYLYSLISGKSVISRKMILMK